MANDTLKDARLPLEHTAGALPPVVSADGSMTNLISRLDAFVQSYSAADAKPAPSASPALTDQGKRDSRTSPTVSHVTEGALRGDVSTLRARQGEAGQNLPRRELPPELKTAKIMMVDDEESTILTVQHHLKKVGYEHFIATTKPHEAFEMIRRQEPDIVLLDIHMPEVSGLDILRAKTLDSTLSHIPVIVLTATTDPGIKQLALDLGATDFLGKPVDPNDLVPRIRNALVVKRHYDQKSDEAARFEELVRQRTAEVVESREQLVMSLARAAEHRDKETGNHVLRVARYAGIIARQLGWSQSQAEMLEQAAPLHDVGKVGVPDSILFKPAKLEPQEFDLIKNHCAWGKQIIEPFSEGEMRLIEPHTLLGENILHVRTSPMLMMASCIAQTHHECWDGTGYPLGLVGEDIPLEGRIVAVADVYDALSTKRPYKKAFPRQKCFEILDEQRGKQFDPRVLDAFFARVADIVAIHLELMDFCPPHKLLREDESLCSARTTDG